MWQKILQSIKGIWPWYKSLYQGRPWYIKIPVALASLIVAFFLYLGAVDINFLWLFGKSPSMSTIKNKRPAAASIIYSADGKQIGKFFSENRTPVTYEEVNPVFWRALIDTEDERFYSHHGIDYTAFMAVAKEYILHRDARGASTITQQLAKNLFRTRSEYSTGLLGNIPGVKMLIIRSMPTRSISAPIPLASRPPVRPTSAAHRRISQPRMPPSSWACSRPPHSIIPSSIPTIR